MAKSGTSNKAPAAAGEPAAAGPPVGPADCVNVNVEGPSVVAGSRELPTASATIDTKVVDTAIAEALAKAGPAHDSTPEITKIAAAVSQLTSTVSYGGAGNIHVIWDSDIVTEKNQLKNGLRVAMHMVDGETGLKD